VLFAQTYKPSAAPGLVKQWKASLEKEGKGKVARLLGVPPSEEEEGDKDMFPEWDEYLRIEREGGTVEDLLVQTEDGEETEGAEEEVVAEDGEGEEEVEEDEEDEE
jgi:coatomer subunit beta'